MTGTSARASNRNIPSVLPLCVLALALMANVACAQSVDESHAAHASSAAEGTGAEFVAGDTEMQEGLGAASASQSVRIDVAYLSSDLLEGRATGTRGEALAAEYIASRFAQIGLSEGASDGSWFQPFAFAHSANPHAPAGEGEQLRGRNVIGLLDRGDARTVVIGAHYDHLGYGGFGSRSPGDSLIHNGADDNASGVAALLAIAERLQDAGDLRHNYLFVAFSGEELGLFGSKHFVEDPPADEILYMINLDMVGRLGPDRRLAVNGTGTSPLWDSIIDAASQAHALEISKHASGLGPSDHASFYLKDIPVLHLFTGQHDEYHKPEDDSHLIDYAGIEDIADFVVDIAARLDDRDEVPFTPTRDESASRMSFNVTLGVMPDYVSDVPGMRIDAVLADRPAAHAGLQEGDIVIRLGEHEIGSMQDYMEALSHFEPGDKTTVVVRRGDEELERPVQF